MLGKLADLGTGALHLGRRSTDMVAYSNRQR